jgi:hypothetical protein
MPKQSIQIFSPPLHATKILPPFKLTDAIRCSATGQRRQAPRSSIVAMQVKLESAV